MPSQIAVKEVRQLNLEALRKIEKLGGSTGYKNHLESARKQQDRPKVSKIRDPDWISTPVVGGTWTALVYTGLYMSAPADGQSGSGDAWGVGIGGTTFAGIMYFAGWDILKSAPNDFYIVGDDEVAGGITIYLSINGSHVGTVVAAAEGLDILIGIDGTFTWN